jgi:hypothetical protein
MSQCKAQTQSGTQCVANAAPPSKSLCGRHQKLLAAGTPVVNFESGRKFPAPAANGTRATSPKPAVARAVRAAPAAARSAAAARSGAAGSELESAREPRMVGEHPLTCDAPQCSTRTLAGSNYCMTHQSLA